ncbi:MAG: cation/H(+) antiporter [Verrucomicrobia bacterium]|nr:cation/H(+) antiporter [Verrucomicrobiota bacterium]
MHGLELVQDLAVVMAAAAVATIVCQRLKQPVVLGYILAGIVIGPNTPPVTLVKDEEAIKTLSELGVILLMFSIGIHFSFRKLRDVGVAAVVAAVVEIAAMFLLGYEAGRWLGWNKMDAIFLGAILSISSTTIIAKALEAMGLMRREFARLVFGILIVEDILAVAMLGILTHLGTTGEIDLASTGTTMLSLTAFLVGVAVVGFLIIPRLIDLASRTEMEEVLLITVLGLIFGISLLAHKLGFSVALGAFLAGAVLAEVRQVKRIDRLVGPLRDVFSAIFFTSSGMLIKFDFLKEGFGVVIWIILLVLVGKILFSGLGALLGGCDLRTATRAGFSVAQIGEFSFIIAGLGITLGVMSDRLYSIAVLVSAATTLTTPYLIAGSGAAADWLERKGPAWFTEFYKTYHSWLRSLGAASQGRHRMAWDFVRKLLWQLLLQLTLIAACLLSAAALWRTYGDRFPDHFAVADWGAPLFWVGGAMVALPVVVAWIRKFHALAVLLSEIAFPRDKKNGQAGPGRKLSQALFLGAGYLAFTLILILLSAPLLPTGKLVLGLFGLAALLAVLARKKLVHLYSQGQAKIRETWETPPDQDGLNLPGESTVHVHQVDPQSLLLGKTLAETHLRKQTGAVVVAIDRKGNHMVSPGPETRLEAGDQLFVFGEKEQVRLADEYLRKAGTTEV